VHTRTSTSASRANGWRKRFLLLSFLAPALCAGGFAAGPAPASAGETAKFIITIQSVQLKNNTGQWITVIEPDRRVDLVDEEASISFFNNTGRVPPGNYINYRIVLSETVTFAGRIKSNNSKAGGRSTIGGPAAKASELGDQITLFREDSPTWDGAQMGEVVEKIDFDGQDADEVITITGKRDFPTAFEVKKGSFIRVWFSVKVEEAVQHAWPGAFSMGLPPNDVMYALPPERIEELTVTVDERTEACSPENIVIEL